MKKQLVATLFIIFAPFIFVSCVSTLLKEKPPTFSEEISYKAPAPPFARQHTDVFPAWKNPQTGNIITIISDCQNSAASSLTSLHRMIEGSLEKVVVGNEESIEFQGRPAVSRAVQAELDGHKIELYSVSFKRLNCGYVSSLSGKPGSLSADRKIYEQFMNGLTFK